jgi:hypothetical protein
MDFRLLNGKPKVTIIERFDQTVKLIYPNNVSHKEFSDMHSCIIHIDEQGWAINVEHLHGNRKAIERR